MVSAAIFQVLVLFLICFPLASTIDFNYPAVFNFGDSNSDTGGLVAGVGDRLDPPNGQTYFQKPSGRFCDGRLIIDFLSKILFSSVIASVLTFRLILILIFYVPVLLWFSGCNGSPIFEPLLGFYWHAKF